MALRLLGSLAARLSVPCLCFPVITVLIGNMGSSVVVVRPRRASFGERSSPVTGSCHKIGDQLNNAPYFDC